MATPKKKTTGRTTPRKEAPEKLSVSDVTDASQWKKDTKQEYAVRVPSGHVALLRHVDMRKFMTADIMPNSLLPIVQDAMDAASKKNTVQKDKKLQEMATNPEAIQQMSEFLDKVALLCVVKPVLAPAPPEGVERDESVFYVDDVDLEDKLFIFNWAVGGTQDLGRFRQELAENVEPVPAG